MSYQLLKEKILRQDHAKDKRVELHLHTNMSKMTGLSSAKALITCAAEFGQKAISITDSGSIEAFPEAMDAADQLASNGKSIKVIYGMEAYCIDDMRCFVRGKEDGLLDGEFIVFDLETTGLSCKNDRIIEIGAVHLKKGKILSEFNTCVNPGIRISERTTELSGITNEMIAEAPSEKEAIAQFYAFCGDCRILVTSAAWFQTAFLQWAAERNEKNYLFTTIDALAIAKSLHPNMKDYRLRSIADTFGVQLPEQQYAVDTARLVATAFTALTMEMRKKYRIETVSGIRTIHPSKLFRKLWETTILVKDTVGMQNLYKLVKLSNTESLSKRDSCISKSELKKYRKGLLVGSAGTEGELFAAIVQGLPWQELSEIARFYDFLEIQPLGNSIHLLRNHEAESEEQLMDFNRVVVRLGEELNIPVCATGHVLFCDPEDSIYQSILRHGRGFEDTNALEPMYLHTTEEMLAEFDYLGWDKAYQIVVTNPSRIADMVEELCPIPNADYPSAETPQRVTPTLSTRTARKFVRTFAKERGLNLSDSEIEKLAQGLSSVKLHE